MSAASSRVSRFAAALALCVAAGAAAAQNGAAREQIVWSAESWARTGNTYVFRRPVIEGADIRIEADEAMSTTLEFNGRWELNGSILMGVGTARLRADTAVFDFRSAELVSAELAGEPALFEETEPEEAGPVRGEASRLVYDRSAGTVQMQGSATFTRGQNRMSGCDFLYELDGGLVSGSSECGVPLSITFVPDDDGDGDGAGDEDAADAESPAAP